MPFGSWKTNKKTSVGQVIVKIHILKNQNNIWDFRKQLIQSKISGWGALDFDLL